LGTALEIGPDDVEVALTLTPTATATGRLLDEKGEPARRTRLRWGRRAPSSSVPDPAGAVVFEPRAVTDDDGRFTLPALIVGQKYEIGVRPEADAHVPSLGFVRPERPGPIDLGTLRVQPEGRE